jgi:hypothetical protein
MGRGMGLAGFEDGEDNPLEEYEFKGRFWIDSQIAGYLWQLTPFLLNRILQNSAWKQLQGKPYLGFHVRKSDNVETLQGDWGLRALELYSFKRFMKVANSVRRRYPGLNTIYIATDNKKVLKESTNSAWAKQGWRFVHNHNAKRYEKPDVSEDHKDWEWMMTGKHVDYFGIILDIHILMHASGIGIIGSQTSNVYRLATVLNAFHHNNDKKRSFEVDRVAWRPGP